MPLFIPHLPFPVNEEGYIFDFFTLLHYLVHDPIRLQIKVHKIRLNTHIPYTVLPSGMNFTHLSLNLFIDDNSLCYQSARLYMLYENNIHTRD